MNVGWVLSAAGAVVVVGGALVVLIKAGAWVFRTWRRINEFLEDWNGEEARPGWPKRLGVMERLVDLETHAQAIVHEVQPNSGLSLRDSVQRIELHTVPTREER